MKNGWTEALAEKDKEIEKHAEMLQQRGEIIVRLDKQIAALKKWVNDLQSGMYINCVYCGHRYGPNVSTPVAMADVLKEHIEKCPKHPLSEARREIAGLKARVSELDGALRLCLAVASDDPLIITPAEKEIVILREQITTLTESHDEWKRQWRLMEAAEKKAEEQIVALKEENIRLKEELECYKLNPDEKTELISKWQKNSFAFEDENYRLRKQIAALKVEIERLKFGCESLPCPRADK